MALDYQKLDAYRHALTLLQTCDEIAARRREAPQPLTQRALHELEIVVAMLVKLIQSAGVKLPVHVPFFHTPKPASALPSPLDPCPCTYT